MVLVLLSPLPQIDLVTFDKIRRIVMADPDLMKSLTQATTEAQLFDDVIALGLEHGVQLTREELAEVMRSNRRAWFERWLPQ